MLHLIQGLSRPTGGRTLADAAGHVDFVAVVPRERARFDTRRIIESSLMSSMSWASISACPQALRNEGQDQGVERHPLGPGAGCELRVDGLGNASDELARSDATAVRCRHWQLPRLERGNRRPQGIAPVLKGLLDGRSVSDALGQDDSV